ncbi:MAG: hypothetical protein JWM32_1279 [Verrucomicrobia bacterium]|nr:hypothetical protein [Verrucomicrobiota bacterium]
MVLYSYTQRRTLLREHARKVLAFSLLEILLALFILGILASFAAPGIGDAFVRSRVEAERRTLEDLERTMVASFESTDLSALNLAALPGTIGPADMPTEFSQASSGAYATTNANSWFAKVARARGVTPQVGVPPSPSDQPALAQIVTNAFGNPRLLFAAPSEPGQQRFLLVSLMAPESQLALPAYEGSAAWFDAIANQNWESRTARIPAYWMGRLSGAQLAAWENGHAGLTSAWRLCVRQIVLKKYVLHVNNNHATANGYLSFNNTPNVFQAPASSGATTTPEILGGRQIVVTQGTAWPGTTCLDFHLHQNDSIFIQ